jgi:Ca2+-binding RTX toxin-like protein
MFVPAQSEQLEPRMLLAQALGAEFRVNTFTTNGQFAHSVASDASGDFVVVWQGVQQNGDYDIYARRYDASGKPKGGDFQVNTYTNAAQYGGYVACNDAGDFVITWTSMGQDSPEYNSGVYAQRYNSAGVRQGGEFRVNSFTTGSQYSPSIAIDADGDFVIAWAGDGTDSNQSDVYARRYNAAGVAQGNEFRVNPATANSQYQPIVTMGDGGGFVIIWNSDGTNDAIGLHAQRYDGSGVALGGQFRINADFHDGAFGAAVASDADGNFVVAWQGRKGASMQEDIYARRFSASGAAIGQEFRVNSFTTNSQQAPSVSMNGEGDFVVAWCSYEQDGSSAGAYARVYSSAGVPQTGEFRANTYTTGNQLEPHVAVDADGDFVVAWSSPDGGKYGVYAQRFGEPASQSFAELDNGKLLIQGTEGHDTIALAPNGAQLRVIRNGSALEFVTADVSAIEIDALGGNDKVTVGAGVIGAYVLGGSGDDSLTGGTGDDSLAGAAGRDRLEGFAGNDRLAGGKHGDVLIGGDGKDRCTGDDGDDLIDCGGGADSARGGAGNDTLLGGNQNDTLHGDAGRDSIRGQNHNDRIFPGAGPDTASGDRGNDRLFAQDGTVDTLSGGAGDDSADADPSDLLSSIGDSP